MFLSAVTCKWGWRRWQGVQRGREAVTGGPWDVAGWGARAGREAAAATSQAFRTTAPGMTPRRAHCGARGSRGSAALVQDQLRFVRTVGSARQEWGAFPRPL